MATILNRLGTGRHRHPVLSGAAGQEQDARLISRTFTRLVDLISGYRLNYYNGCALYRRYHVMRWAPYNYGFGFQADLITRLLDEGASYVEVPVSGFHLTKERGRLCDHSAEFRLDRTYTVRDLCSDESGESSITTERVRGRHDGAEMMDWGNVPFDERVRAFLVCPKCRRPFDVREERLWCGGCGFEGAIRDDVVIMSRATPTSYFDDKFQVMQEGHSQGRDWEFAYRQQVAFSGSVSEGQDRCSWMSGAVPRSVTESPRDAFSWGSNTRFPRFEATRTSILESAVRRPCYLSGRAR